MSILMLYICMLGFLILKYNMKVVKYALECDYELDLEIGRICFDCELISLHIHEHVYSLSLE